MDFEWDELKAATNLEKHGVSFIEAKIVFAYDLAVVLDDEAHSVDEKREIIIPIQPIVTNCPFAHF
jgi:uncharacterized protein